MAIEAAESSAVAVTNRVPTARSFRGTLEMTVTVFRDGKRAFAKSSDLSVASPNHCGVDASDAGCSADFSFFAAR
ncbi:MAG: hypothetical protein V4801_28040 [Burkholderia gladioli]